MFSLQPPRHISTLPDSDLRRCSLSRRYGAQRISNARLGACAWLVVLDGWWRIVRRRGRNWRVLDVRRLLAVLPAGADANPGIEHPRLLHPAVWTRHQVLDRRLLVSARVLLRSTRWDRGVEQSQERRAGQ